MSQTTYRVISVDASDVEIADILNFQSSEGFDLWDIFPRDKMIMMIFTHRIALESEVQFENRGATIAVHEPYSAARMKTSEVLFSLYVEEDELVRKGSPADIMVAIENRMLAQVMMQLEGQKPPDIGPFVIEIHAEEH